MTTDIAHRRRWWALAVIAMAQFMVIMDTSIVGVALPQMKTDLGFSQASLTWVVNAFLVAFGGLLLLGGRLSDLFGAKKMFSTGWLILLLGSILAALAQTPWLEILARGVQGAGAALIAPAALTLLMMLFGSEPKELGKALSLYGAAAPAGGTAGVFLGGVLTGWLSWPWVFYLYIPFALVALAVVPALMPAGSPRRGSVDVAGALAVTAGLALAVFGIVGAPARGWASGTTIAVLNAAAALLVAFVVIESKRRAPLMRLSILRTPNLGAANLSQLLLGGAWVPMWFFLNLYLQQVLGFGAFAAGAALLPMTVLIMVLMIGVAPKVIASIGTKAPIVLGLLALAGALVWFSFIDVTGTFTVDVLGPSLLAAVGQGLAFVPSLGMAISSARPEEGGLASGIVNTSYQVGSAIGLAGITAVAAAYGADQLGDTQALTHGFSVAFLSAAGIAVLGGLVALAAIRTARIPATEPAAAQETADAGSTPAA
ncbi:MAG TPA: MFS transporter [Segeticoccus sp.]|nr:MFS transporter [Segeticoccus sp.]